MAVAFLQVLASINELPLLWMTYDTALPRTTFLAQQIATLVGEATEVRLWQEMMELRLIGQDSDPPPIVTAEVQFRQITVTFRRRRWTYETYESLLSVDCRT